MSITSKTDRFGIDVVIEELQQMSEPRLLAFWSGIAIADYNSYPRANKNWKDADKLPEISLDQKEYQGVLFDDTLSVTSFWIVSDQRVFSEATKQLKTTISIIFQANLVKIYGQTNRADEEFNMNVLNVFKKDNFYINSDIQIVEGIENVYSDLTFSEEINNNVKKHNMSDFHIVKFTFDVIHDPDCFPKLAPVCPPGGSPCSVTLNTDPLTDIAGGTSKAMTIRHEDDSPVVVTTITDTASLFIGEIPNPIPAALNTSNIFKTGQTTSFRTGDDGDLETGRGSSWTVLDHNNGFGNTNRFTDELGLQLYANNLVLDWAYEDQVNATVLMWWRIMQTSKNWNNGVDESLASTQGGFSNWFLPNIQFLSSIYNGEPAGGSDLTNLNYSPVNVDLTGGLELWSSSRSGLNNRYITVTDNGVHNVRASTDIKNYIQVRISTLTELGL